MQVYEVIKQKRVESGLSQYQLAEKTKMLNQSQLSKIENGSRSISIDDLFCIAGALGVEASDLIKDNRTTKKGEDT